MNADSKSQRVPKSPRAKALLEFVEMVLSNSKLQDSAHDLDHVMRVWKIGMQIGEAEHADLEILEPALLLHDIIRPESFLEEPAKDPKKLRAAIKFGEAKKDDHGIESARISKKILNDFMYNGEEIEKITHAIEAHTQAGKKNSPKTLEAKIVYDADCYDVLGYSGCARAALFCAKQKMTTSQMGEWYLSKIKNMLKSAPFYTKTAIRLANERLTLSLDFCKELVGERRFEEIMKK